MSGNKYEGKIERMDECRWRLPRDPGRGMVADGIVYADETLFRDLRNDAALWQVANVACLPGLVGPSLAMPDCHYGYGFPIGGVAATDMDKGVISPGGVGYDINCGVRLLRTDLTVKKVAPHVEDLINQIFRDVPSGEGKSGDLALQDSDLDGVLVKGAGWVVEQGYGRPEDLDVTEERGAMPGADPEALTDRARKRGRPQLGTLGGGNHFLEIQAVEEVYDENAARAMGIDDPGQVVVMIHCGSRGLGHQVCDDALEVMQQAVHEYDIHLPDRQLACVPVGSPEGKRYFAAMAGAANYAWANRQTITHRVREAFERVLRAGTNALGMDMVWDVAHNIAKVEEHPVGGMSRRLCVHRKGATRAFGPGRPEVPARYRALGQPVIVPGDMGTASYLLLGTETAMRETWGSTCHGAGRVMSRKAALKRQTGDDVISALKARGITVRSAGKRTLAEEASEAYKDVHAVVDTCIRAGISAPVARMRPIAVMKG